MRPFKEGDPRPDTFLGSCRFKLHPEAGRVSWELKHTQEASHGLEVIKVPLIPGAGYAGH